MVPPRRFQNTQLGRLWPGTKPSLSELLSDNDAFDGFAKAVEINVATQPIRNRMAAEAAIERRRYVDRDLVGLVSEATAHQTEPAPSRIQIGDRVIIDSALDESGDVQIVVGFPNYSDNDEIVVTLAENGSGRIWTVNRANMMFVGHDLKKALECRAFHLRAKPGYLRKEPIDG